jgi:predicted RNA-binding protein YlxR (DUF448 family)
VTRGAARGRRLVEGTLRPRHLPQRTCVGCRKVRPKRELVRVVRPPEGLVDLDPTGRAPGRGGYLCSDGACWSQAQSRRQLDRALAVTLGESDWERLRASAKTKGLWE